MASSGPRTALFCAPSSPARREAGRQGPLSSSSSGCRAGRSRAVGGAGAASSPRRALPRVAVRVERSGAGDSLGPACHELDYDTELRHYQEAYDAISRHPWIDPRRIVVYGSSLGATIAPLVAAGRPVAGVLSRAAGRSPMSSG